MKKVIFFCIAICSSAIVWGQTLDEYREMPVEKLQELAGRGNPEAQIIYGFYLEKKGNYSEALRWIQRSAEQGLSFAQFHLGNYYMDGYEGLTQSEKEAERWYKKSAEQEFLQAQIALGKYYRRNGDTSAALSWFEKAKENRNASQEDIERLEKEISEIKKTVVKKATYVRTEPNEVKFDDKVGSKDITVYSDGRYKAVSNKPDWCKVKINDGYFTITCDPNKGAERTATITVTADDKETKVTVQQAEYRATYLNTNGVTSVKIPALGDTKTVTINTDGYDWKYSVTPHSPWLIDSKSGKTLTLKAYRNQGSVRNATITLTPTSGNVTPVTITVTQPKEATYIRVEGSNTVHFSPKGDTKKIEIETDGDDWSFNKPYWITNARKNGNTLTLECGKNYGSKNEDKVTFRSDNATPAYITVKQRGIFNSLKDDGRLFGFSAGYVIKQWEWKDSEGSGKYGIWEGDKLINGIQAGVRIEPLFKYGFGLNTGLFYEYYFATSKEDTGTYRDMPGTYQFRSKYTEHSLHLPVHLEYRAHFHKQFQIFACGGASIDLGLLDKVTSTDVNEENPYYAETNFYGRADDGLGHKRFNLSADVGAGFRINGVQLNVGTSYGLLDISTIPGVSIKQNKLLTASLSWMIPNTDPVNTTDRDEYGELGFTTNFISKQWEYTTDKYFDIDKGGLWEDSKFVPGFRVGFVYQPNFILGFGLRTGLNSDMYFSKSGDIYDEYGNYHISFFEWTANIPAHIEYRLHFNDIFSIFFETGASLDIGLIAQMKAKDSSGEEFYTENDIYGQPDWGYPSERLNAYWDFEAGFRIKWFQLSAGISRGLHTVSVTDINGYEWKARQNRNFMVGVSFFP